MIENIKANFTESIQTKIAASEMLPPAIDKAAMIPNFIFNLSKNFKQNPKNLGYKLSVIIE